MAVAEKRLSLPSEIALRERIKELTCLYGISQLALQRELSLNKLLEQILKLIPPAWQYPEITAARIILDNHTYITPRFEETPYRQAENININKKRRGLIEVFYLEKCIEADEGPFLKEERKLLQGIANELALIIEHKESIAEREGLYKQIRHADRLATIGQLTSGIAHEINEPLNNILGFAELILKYHNITEPVKDDIDKIKKSTLNAREIIKKLMYFSKQIPQFFREVDLNQIIKEAMYFLELQCQKENITVLYELAKGLPLLHADPVQLNQVIVNLVVNSIQAMPAGGELSIKTYSEGENIILIIKDTGIGISKENKEKIFEPFFSTKDVGRGTGLGLSVVHGILTAHNSQISVHSVTGKGTQFRIRFPLSDKHEK